MSDLFLRFSANLVSCEKFVEVGGLGFLFGALSSDDLDIRGAACHALQLFSEHLQGAHKYVHRDQVGR